MGGGETNKKMHILRKMECLTSFFWFVKISPKGDNLNKNLAVRIMYDTEVWFKYINKIFYKSCTKKKKDQRRNKWNRDRESNSKTNEMKSWFFEKTNKIDKPSARLTKQKKQNKTERTQIKLEMKREKLQDTTKIQKLIRDHYK